MPLSPSLDTVGWFARSADIYERVGAVLLGEDVAGPALGRMVVAEDVYALLLGDGRRRGAAAGDGAGRRASRSRPVRR